MILNKRSVIFLLIVFLIVIALFHNKLKINKSNSKLLLLAIILSIFIFYNQFVTPRVEKYIEDDIKEKFDEENEDSNSTPSILRRLYLNKSNYHKTFTSSKPIHKMSTSGESNDENDDKKKNESIMQSVLNLYNNEDDTVNTTETTIKDGTPLENLLKFNYLSTDDMIKNIGKRHYDFPVVNLNFNQNEKAVSEDNKASPNEISTIIYNSENKNNSESEKDTKEETKKDTKDDTEKEEDDNDKKTQKRTSVVSQQSSQDDGIFAFLNNFFTIIQEIFQ